MAKPPNKLPAKLPPLPPPGALNDLSITDSAPVMDTSHGANPMLYVGSSTRESYASDIRKGTSRYQGIVLRAEKINDQDSTAPSSWIQEIFGVTKPPLPSYRVHVPEFHQAYARPSSYDDPASQIIIDTYPKFVAQSTSTEPAEVGALVWVTYGNTQTFENPIYLGPVQSTGNQDKAGGGGSTNASASSAGCGGGKSLQTPPATGQPNEPTSSEPTSSEPTSSSGEQVPKIPPPPSSPQNCQSGGPGGTTDQSAGIADKTNPFPLTSPKAKLVKIKFDNGRYGKPARRQGGGTAKLREDVANDLSQVKKVVNELGGVLSSAGTNPNGLNVKAATSFHPLWMAFDMNTTTCSLNAWKRNDWDFEYFLTPSGSGKRRFFDVWARSDKPAGTTSEGFTVQNKTLDVAVRRSGWKKRTNSWEIEQYTGNFIPITAIMKAYGFGRISIQKPFYYPPGNAGVSEWWHFQSQRQGVINQTTWGDLAKLHYPDDKINNLPFNTNRIFRGSYFSGKK